MSETGTAEVDVSTWPDKKAVAETLDCSTRQVEKYASEGRFGKVEYVRGKRGRESRYKPEAVESWKAELARQRQEVIGHTPSPVALAPRGAQPQALAIVEQITTGLERQHADAERVAGLLESIRDALANGHKPEGVAVTEKLMLTLDEAAALSGLSWGHLREAIKADRLKAQVIGRGFKVKRADLDAYVRKF